MVGNPNAPERFWLLSFLLHGELCSKRHKFEYDWPNPTKSTYVSPPFHVKRVFKSWVIFDTEVPRKMECRSKLSTFKVAIRNLIQVPKLNCVLTCTEGVFLIDFATRTLRKIEKQFQLFPLRCFAIPPQTRTFPCEAIHPGVDLPSLPNQILFEKSHTVTCADSCVLEEFCIIRDGENVRRVSAIDLVWCRI